MVIEFWSLHKANALYGEAVTFVTQGDALGTNIVETEGVECVNRHGIGWDNGVDDERPSIASVGQMAHL